MAKITNEFRVEKYVVLCVEPFPNKLFKSVEIEGSLYDVEPLYDLHDCIAIRANSDDSFVGKTVSFK